MRHLVENSNKVIKKLNKKGVIGLLYKSYLKLFGAPVILKARVPHIESHDLSPPGARLKLYKKNIYETFHLQSFVKAVAQKKCPLIHMVCNF